MRYTREQLRDFIKCPQLGSEEYGAWGALRLEQKLAINDLLDVLDSADAYIEKLEKENYIKFERILKYEKTLENLQKDTIWKSELEEDYIPKSVIREKIEEIRKTHSPEDDYACSQIHILKKLLGDEDENRNKI